MVHARLLRDAPVGGGLQHLERCLIRYQIAAVLALAGAGQTPVLEAVEG
jgi:hypothetical protein